MHIKYVNSYKREDLYRLYSEDMTSEKEKIPYLNKAIIFKLKKMFTKTNTIGMYLNDNIVCELDKKGNLLIKLQFKELTDIESIVSIIRERINPIIKRLNKIVIESGYKLNLFEDMTKENIELLDCKYKLLTKIKYEMKIKHYIACMSNLFSVFEDKQSIHMRYKKVKYFNEMSAKEAHIIELINKQV